MQDSFPVVVTILGVAAFSLLIAAPLAWRDFMRLITSPPAGSFRNEYQRRKAEGFHGWPDAPHQPPNAKLKALYRRGMALREGNGG